MCDWLCNLCGLTSGANKPTPPENYQPIPNPTPSEPKVKQMAQKVFNAPPPVNPPLQRVFSPSPTKSSASKQSGEGTDQEVSSPPDRRQK